MIRRGFWFAAGAVAGVAGYRRAARAARSLLPRPGLSALTVRPVTGQSAAAALPGPGRQGPGARRDETGRLPGGSSRSSASKKAAAGTAAFVRDVRAGMADYLDQHRGI